MPALQVSSHSHVSKLEKAQRKEAAQAMNDNYPSLTEKAPSWLDSIAKKEWNRIIPLLKQSNVISNLDTSLIADHCTLYSTIVKTTKAINREGEVIEGKNGPTQSPESRIREKAIKELKSIDSQIALSPISRARLELHKAMDTDEPKDEFEALIDG